MVRALAVIDIDLDLQALARGGRKRHRQQARRPEIIREACGQQALGGSLLRASLGRSSFSFPFTM